jgi:uncharacterized 2Fe-2S/4Fe-4S cluster protein (DUF4445 family)
MSPLYYDRKRIDLTEGKTIFDHADDLQLKVPTSCGRAGTCHECIVEITRGMEALSERSESEQFLRDNYRLACQCRVLDPRAEIAFALMKRRRQIVTAGQPRAVELDPLTRRVGDDVYFGDQRIDVYRGAIYGLAIDVGTTTVVLNLVDLETGAVRYTSSLENPQRFAGSDVMNRISYDSGPFQGELHLAIINAINTEIREMCRQLRFIRRLIYEIVVVGNATMRDLFFNLDVRTIGEKPYRSLTEFAFLNGERTTTALTASARDLGLRINLAGMVYGGPLIGSHVGADASANLLAIGVDELTDDEPFMLIDIGTNTEVIVGTRQRMLAASCPAGPAFEGGRVTYGMPGYDGAIESFSSSGASSDSSPNGRLHYDVIGGGEPEGICGSGLIDLLTELVLHRRMSPLGTFEDGTREIVIVPEKSITFSRADASELAQAKAANSAGQLILLRSLGVTVDQLKRIYLAGGFANYINVANAIAIGLIPNLPLEKIVKIGNAALEGATILLRSRAKREFLERLAPQIEHVELEMAPDFFDIFVEGCAFEPMNVACLTEAGLAVPLEGASREQGGETAL